MGLSDAEMDASTKNDRCNPKSHPCQFPRKNNLIVRSLQGVTLGYDRQGLWESEPPRFGILRVRASRKPTATANRPE